MSQFKLLSKLLSLQRQWQKQQMTPPPMPQLPRKKARRPLRVGIAVVVLIAIIMTACGNQGKQQTTATSTPQATIVNDQSTDISQAATQPTLKSTYAVTPSAVTGSAIIGADLSAFTAKYGQPNTSQGGDTFGSLSVTFDNNQAIAILDQSANTGWSKSAALAFCMALAPPDATYERQMTLLDPQGNIQAIQRVYFSGSLAPHLPPSDFTDEKGNPDKPGTFGIVLTVDATNTNLYDSCSTQAGLQQQPDHEGIYLLSGTDRKGFFLTRGTHYAVPYYKNTVELCAHHHEHRDSRKPLPHFSITKCDRPGTDPMGLSSQLCIYACAGSKTRRL